MQNVKDYKDCSKPLSEPCFTKFILSEKVVINCSTQFLLIHFTQLTMTFTLLIPVNITVK